MKISHLVLIIALAITNTCYAIAHTRAKPEIGTNITQLIKAKLPDAAVGVIVQDAATGEILYDYHGGKYFLPASTTKLFTAAAALKLLGPDYRYNTTLYQNQEDIILKFSGDPSFELKSLYNLLQKLSAANIKVIKGNFIIDDTAFSGPMWALGWTWDSTPWYHAAPVSAIIIDRNQFGVTLMPAPKVGAKVLATLDQDFPASKFRTMIANVHAVTYEDSETLCQITTVVDENNNLELGGCWPIGTEPVQLRLAIKNPRLQATQLILEALQKLNIKLIGKISFAPLPSNAAQLAQHSSEPLAVLIKPILTESNNLYAESLTKTLGARMYGVGSFKTGSAAIQKVMSEITGVNFANTKMLDGSGESRYNLFTPKHLASLLYSMRSEPQIATHFRNALAISGMNGSLQKRFINLAPVQAKTGSLNGVSTLAGYFTTRHKRELIVAIMINHAMETSVLLKQFEDDLCYYLVEQL